MKAICWFGTHDVRVMDVPEPKIANPHDAIVKVTLTAICGSDLHMYNGYVPAMEDGDILGHESMGEVVATGPAVDNLKPGDRVVIPFPIACGQCWYCKQGLWSACDNTNPQPDKREELYGAPGAGIFGYSHLEGGYAGGQAEYVRVPFANVGLLKVPSELPDDKVLFLSDILPTAYQAALYAGISQEDVVAVWGCGPVGLLTIRCAQLLGAGRVIAIDAVAERLGLAESFGAEVIDYTRCDDMSDELIFRTGGRGPDSCIDAVGLEAKTESAAAYAYDRVKQGLKIETDRPYALRQAIQACRKGGTVSIVGVYAGFLDHFNMGTAFAKGLTFKMGQCHVHKHMRPLLEHIQNGKLDPSEIISHRLRLADAPTAYQKFNDKEERHIKIVMTP